MITPTAVHAHSGETPDRGVISVRDGERGGHLVGIRDHPDATCAGTALVLFRVFLFGALILAGSARFADMGYAASASTWLLVALAIPSPILFGLALTAAIRQERPTHLVVLALCESLPGLGILGICVFDSLK